MAGISITQKDIDFEDGGTIGSSSNRSMQFYGNVNDTETYNRVYGCKFAWKVLLNNSNISTGTSYTFSNNASFLDYQFITILGGTKYTRGVVTFPASIYTNWYDQSHRLVISSDAEYLAVYFPSSTNIYIEGKSSALKEILIYGIK